MAAELPANFTIVTLGVIDLDRSVSFYRSLGWEQRGDPAEGILWFRTSGTWLGLYGYEPLADDVGLPAGSAADLPAYRGITLALNFGSEAEVDAAFEQVADVGADIVKPPTRADWGGYSGYFADPDGNLWEIAFAPSFPVDPNGRIEIT
ncbi:MAG: VOC family protein [Actinomycetota bacterium]|nr:VOC family protein [Actinomycetota bacterium]